MDKEKRKIQFEYKRETKRIYADSGDVYNWLLDYDEKIAANFLDKVESVEKSFRKQLAKESDRV